MSQPPSSRSQVCVRVRVCLWWMVQTHQFVHVSWVHTTSCVCPCSNMSQQMLPEASAASPVMWCPLTFSNIWRCSGSLVKDSAPLWQIMRLCLSLICLIPRSAIWHLHQISMYLWASHLTLQCEELVGITPVRVRGRCHSDSSHSGGLGEEGGWGWGAEKV